MPRVCCTSDVVCDAICPCAARIRSPEKADVRLCIGEAHESVGRVEVQVWIERAGVRTAKSVRRMGARRVRASILMVSDWNGRIAMLRCCAVTLMVSEDVRSGKYCLVMMHGWVHNDIELLQQALLEKPELKGIPFDRKFKCVRNQISNDITVFGFETILSVAVGREAVKVN